MPTKRSKEVKRECPTVLPRKFNPSSAKEDYASFMELQGDHLTFRMASMLLDGGDAKADATDKADGHFINILGYISVICPCCSGITISFEDHIRKCKKAIEKYGTPPSMKMLSAEYPQTQTTTWLQSFVEWLQEPQQATSAPAQAQQAGPAVVTKREKQLARSISANRHQVAVITRTVPAVVQKKNAYDPIKILKGKTHGLK